MYSGKRPSCTLNETTSGCSSDPAAVDLFALEPFVQVDEASMCYAGYWSTSFGTNANLQPLFTSDLDAIVIHDPEMGDHRVRRMEGSITRLVYILSHGHDLITYWATKGKSPRKYYMPLWSKEEAESCAARLVLNSQEEEAPPLRMDEVGDCYKRFGGCIRDWVTPDHDEFWNTLESTIREVVKNNGDNVLVKSTSVRGSIVHLHVDFDEDRRIIGFDDDDDEMLVDQPAAAELEVNIDDGKEPNEFGEFNYIFGSDDILVRFNKELLEKGNSALQLCVNNWSSPSAGFECLYGAIFELRCHRKFEDPTGGPKLRMRIVYNPEKTPASNHDIGAFIFPKSAGTIRYKSNDPHILSEDPYKDKMAENKYLWPYSSNHPSYDAAVVVDAADLKLPCQEVKYAGLLLQMTVSGATQLPRRPEHGVKQHVRKAFDTVFKASDGIKGYKGKDGAAFTAFVVPTECFTPFQFQKETDMKGKDVKDQPDFQLVFEMPDQFPYKRASFRSKIITKSLGKKRHFHKFDEAALEESSSSVPPQLTAPPAAKLRNE